VDELTVTFGRQQVTIRPGQVVTIGRREDSAVVVDDPRVSREHVRLSWGPHGGWVLQNVGRAGTFVAGKPVSQVTLGATVQARLAAPDGPVLLLEPAEASGDQSGAGGPGGGAGRQASTVPAGQVRPAEIFDILVPVRRWLTDPALRQRPRLLVAAYALAPVVLLILLQNTTDLKTLGWVYCLYVAPLWAIVFWWLIKPGQIGRLHLVVAGVVIAAEFLLIPALTVPWESSLAPGNSSTNLIQWIYGVGLAEEVTKALPVLVIAVFLVKTRNIKLDVPMWMFVAALSGLTFGVYEASTVYVPQDISVIAQGGAIGIPEFVERVFVDGLQHALWAGVAGFFIGLGTNYRRQRYLLWLLGIAIPAVLHGLNDWSLGGVFGSDLWPWIAIQAFSVFLFLGYTASARAIEQEVRHTPIFRGSSMLVDPSRLQSPGH
jgi:RsiW-degrading membrane proteinase PrsW (M82 family)